MKAEPFSTDVTRALVWPAVVGVFQGAVGMAVVLPPAAVEVAGGPPVAWQPGRIDAEGPGPAHPPHLQLWITGNGNNNPGNPNVDDEDVLVCAVLAVDSGTPCAVLWQVPNAPVVYASDPAKQERSEDAAVAWSCAWWRGPSRCGRKAAAPAAAARQWRASLWRATVEPPTVTGCRRHWQRDVVQP